MADQQRNIQFTKAPDGISIAYWEVGEGPPLVVIHNFGITHAELEWEIPSVRALYEELAKHHRVIRLDQRSSGLSQWTTEVSMDAVMGDVLAVTAAAGVDRFDLLAVSTMAPIGVKIAAEHPERVARLVLCEPNISLGDAEELARYIRATITLAAAESGDMVASFWATLGGSEDTEALIAIATANTPEDSALMVSVNEATLEWKALDLLADVHAPTLILSVRNSLITNQAQVRQAAAMIPDARLVAASGRWAPYFSDREEILRALGDFLDWDIDAGPWVPLDSGVATVVFTDVVASTEVIDREGDTAARTAVRSIEAATIELAESGGGRVVKHLGDGSLLEFESASDALAFAARLQYRLKGTEPQVRIGMAAGEPIREDGDLHGAVVVLASRVTDCAGPGDVAVSAGVRQLVIGKPFTFTDLGEHQLKGFDELVRLWTLDLTRSSP